jgi:hypothetical protein
MTTQPDPQAEPDEPERPLRGPAWAREATEGTPDEELTESEKAHDAATIRTSD